MDDAGPAEIADPLGKGIPPLPEYFDTMGHGIGSPNAASVVDSLINSVIIENT